MKLNKRPLFIAYTSFFLVLLAWDLFLHLSSNHTSLWNDWYNVTYGFFYLLGGVIAITNGVHYGLKTNVGKMLLFFGLGLCFFAIGNGIWAYYNFVLHVALPYPSLADVAFSLNYPCLVLGAFFLVKVYQPLVNRRLLITAVVTALVTFVVIFSLFAKPDLSPGLTFVQKFLNVYNPVGDTVTIILALVALQVGGGKLHRSLYILVSGLLLYGTADLLYAYRTSKGIYWVGDIADLTFTCAAYVISNGLFEIIHNLENKHSTL